MTTRRTARVARAIQETVSTAILRELRDPRVKNVTVLKAEVTEDLRQSKVYVSVMGDDKTQALTMRGLNSARGFLQSKVAARLETKVTPILQFILDPSVKISAAAAVALRELFPGGIGTGAAVGTGDAELDEDETASGDDESASAATEPEQTPAASVAPIKPTAPS